MNLPTNKPPSVLIIGWASVLASGLMVLVNLVSLVSYNMFDTMNLNVPGLSQYVPESMKKVMVLYGYSRIWTAYGIVYFLFVCVAGVQFLRLRAWGRTALEIACWVGLLNAVVDTMLSYMIWQNMQETLSLLMRGIGGGRYSYLHPLGFITIIAGFILWVVPCGGMIVFLRRPKVRETVSLR